jgi:16S rRNA C967 or C1407 C5-methylase (RsmB/RsmF family)/NOL1/NOP2/fmu family ribosome biogenesis protein
VFQSPLPKDFVKRIKAQLGAESQDFVDSLESRATTSLRLHPSKGKNYFPDSEPVRWCENGRLLKKRPKFAEQPELFAGAYYVQESSSMFLDHALKTCLGKQKNLLALDLCAAPGGKSTLISDFLQGNGFLVSNEITSKRLPALVENFTRWGSQNQMITQNSAKDFAKLRGLFDLVVIDAPCSGEGMFRKDLESRQLWSPQLVQNCSKLQREIVADALPALKTDGILVYSTCTFSRAENEENVAWFCEELGLESINLDVSDQWAITQSQEGKTFGYRFYPHKTPGEGFFLSCMRKISSEKTHLPKSRSQTWKAIKKPIELDFFNEPLFQLGENLVSIPEMGLTLNGLLTTQKVGLELGQMKGSDFIPSHQYAMSQRVDSKFTRFEVGKEMALDFLRKKEIVLDTKGLKGWALLEYQGLALGWIKVLANRINNRYPQEYRLLKESL